MIAGDALAGKLAAVSGSALVAGAAALTGDPRLSLISIILGFALGAALVERLSVNEGRTAVRRCQSQVRL